jgi:hypothetical protein
MARPGGLSMVCSLPPFIFGDHLAIKSMKCGLDAKTVGFPDCWKYQSPDSVVTDWCLYHWRLANLNATLRIGERYVMIRASLSFGVVAAGVLCLGLLFIAQADNTYSGTATLAHVGKGHIHRGALRPN